MASLTSQQPWPMTQYRTYWPSAPRMAPLECILWWCFLTVGIWAQVQPLIVEVWLSFHKRALLPYQPHVVVGYLHRCGQEHAIQRSPHLVLLSWAVSPFIHICIRIHICIWKSFIAHQFMLDCLHPSARLQVIHQKTILPCSDRSAKFQNVHECMHIPYEPENKIVHTPQIHDGMYPPCEQPHGTSCKYGGKGEKHGTVELPVDAGTPPPPKMTGECSLLFFPFDVYISRDM